MIPLSLWITKSIHNTVEYFQYLAFVYLHNSRKKKTQARSTSNYTFGNHDTLFVIGYIVNSCRCLLIVWYYVIYISTCFMKIRYMHIVQHKLPIWKSMNIHETPFHSYDIVSSCHCLWDNSILCVNILTCFRQKYMQLVQHQITDSKINQYSLNTFSLSHGQFSILLSLK